MFKKCYTRPLLNVVKIDFLGSIRNYLSLTQYHSKTDFYIYFIYKTKSFQNMDFTLFDNIFSVAVRHYSISLFYFAPLDQIENKCLSFD